MVVGQAFRACPGSLGMLWLWLFLFAGQFDTTFRTGLIALNRNDLATAESQLEAASRLEPRDARVWLALAQTYWKLNRSEASRAAAGKAEALANDPAILRALAVYYSGSGDRSKAAAALESVIRRDPYREADYFDLAQVYFQQQDFAAALNVLDAGRKNFDKSAQLELAAGVACYGLRRFPEAIEAFLRTIRLDPDVEQPYVFLGRMLDQAEGQLPRIAGVFAVYAQRDTWLGNYLYGKALRIAGDSAKAEPLLRKAVAQNDRSWEAHFELGVLLDGQGKYEDAAREIRRGIELHPDDPVAHYRLARLYDRLGKPAEARAERELHARLSTVVK